MKATFDFLLADTFRLAHKKQHARLTPLMQHNEDPTIKEYRYEQRGLDYALRCWHDGRETLARGVIDEQPQWLTDVIDTARVGGYLRHINEPPPDLIVWFCTDEQNNLSHFLELK